MFTGIIEDHLPVTAVADHAGGRRITIPNRWSHVDHGESIALNGVCLTVASHHKHDVTFDVIKETLDKTNLGTLKPDDHVNVEQSLRFGGRIDGHLVQGHVDGVGKLVKKVATADEWRYTIEAPPHVAKFLAAKGSICLDGISLTIANLDGALFEVALIPTTLKLTTLPKREVGYAFNIEADMIAKQIVTFLDARGIGQGV